MDGRAGGCEGRGKGDLCQSISMGVQEMMWKWKRTMLVSLLLLLMMMIDEAMQASRRRWLYVDDVENDDTVMVDSGVGGCC